MSKLYLKSLYFDNGIRWWGSVYSYFPSFLRNNLCDTLFSHLKFAFFKAFFALLLFLFGLGMPVVFDYGRLEDKMIILEKLYNERKDSLSKKGISISFEQLLNYYK